MGTMVQDARQVMLAGAPLEECARRAQVVIVDGGRWHMIAPAPYRMHADFSYVPLPAVTCPVWDVSGVTDFERMRGIMDVCVSHISGVINLAGLVTGLEALGAKRVDGVEPLAVRSKQLEKSSRSLGKVSGVRRQVSRARRRRMKARVQ